MQSVQVAIGLTIGFLWLAIGVPEALRDRPLGRPVYLTAWQRVVARQRAATGAGIRAGVIRRRGLGFVSFGVAQLVLAMVLVLYDHRFVGAAAAVTLMAIAAVFFVAGMWSIAVSVRRARRAAQS